MADGPHARDRFPYPGGNVVGVLLDDVALADARERLGQAGFGPDGYDVLEGERDVGRVDLKGEGHGLAGTIIRRLQGAFSDDADHVRQYAGICGPVTTWSVSLWARMRRLGCAPQTRCAQPTRSSSTTTSRTWAVTAEQRRLRARQSLGADNLH